MNTIKSILEWVKERENDDYTGIPVPKELEEVKSTNKEYEGSKYSKFNSIKDINGLPLKDPSKSMIDDNKFGTYKFILSAGFKENNIEGSSRDDHLLLHAGVFHAFYRMYGRYPKRIAEIGFNAGISAYHFLNMMKEYNNDGDYSMVSFDLGIHPYCFYAKYFIDQTHPSHHLLVDGSSDKSIPIFYKYSDIKFDIIFIDGDHSYYGALQDLINCKNISNSQTIIIADNCVPHRGVGFGVYLAYLKLYHEKYIKHLGFYELNNNEGSYYDASALCVYNFDNDEDNGEIIDYKDRERKMLGYSLARILQNERLSSNDFKTIYKLAKQYINDMDEFFIKKFNRVYLPKYNKIFKLKYDNL